MPRNRVIYQCDNVMVGPPPASGYHFLSQNGALDNSGDFNLILPLYRVQSFSYDFTPRRTEIKELGWRSVVDNPMVKTPDITFQFNYLQPGVINEHRMGLVVNYSTGNNSAPFYANNFNISLISGFWERSDEREYNDLRWPFFQKEPRNYFVPTAPEGNDLNVRSATDPNQSWANPVLCFGNSYLTSYRASASVNSFPEAAVSFVGENISLHMSGTGVPIPAIDVVSGNPLTNLFAIPHSYLDQVTVSVLRPGDINIDIRAYGKSYTGVSGFSGASGIAGQPKLALRPTGHNANQAPHLFDLQHAFTDIKIQSYDINLEFPRQALYDVNAKFPLDRPLSFPIYATIGINAIVGDSITGSIYQFLKTDWTYSLSIKCNNPHPRPGVGIQYDFKGAKLIEKRTSMGIGDNKAAEFRWMVDLDPDDLSKGMWISGEMNFSGNPPITIPDEFLIQEDGPYILQEDGVSRIKVRGVTIF